MKRILFLAALAAAGCSSSGGEQVLTGRVGLSSGVVAVRAVTDTEVVTAAQVRSDGTFTLAVPVGTYRLEMLTSAGVIPVVKTVSGGFEHVGFRVCKAGAPWDVGSVGDAGDPNGGTGSGMGGGGGSDPGDCYNADGTPCTYPPKCDPMTDPSCDLGCYDSNGNQVMCPPPVCDDPADPNCKCDPSTGADCGPPPCDPMTDPSCGVCYDASGNVTMCPPPKCDPSTGADCGCDPTTGENCGPPTCAPDDPSCGVCYDANGNAEMCPPPKCDPTTDPSCSGGGDPGECVDPDGTVVMCCVLPDGTDCAPPPPPCSDPSDPTTCKDPCMDDPASCGCSDGTMCWPAPDPNGPCEGGMEPQNPPGDFGCGDDGNGGDQMPGGDPQPDKGPSGT